MPPLCTEITEDSPPRAADSERTHLRIAVGVGLAQPQVVDMRAQVEATRERPTASPAIAGQPLTAALKGTEPTPATGDSPAANEVLRDAQQARRALVVSAAAAAVNRADPLRTEASAVRTGADTLAVDMPPVDMPAVDTAAVEVIAAADTAAGAKRSALSSPFQPNRRPRSHERGLCCLDASRYRGTKTHDSQRTSFSGSCPEVCLWEVSLRGSRGGGKIERAVTLVML